MIPKNICIRLLKRPQIAKRALTYSNLKYAFTVDTAKEKRFQ